jgi:hypothetical protein
MQPPCKTAWIITFDELNTMIKHGLGRLNLTGLSGFLRLIRDPDPVHVFAHSLPRGLTASRPHDRPYQDRPMRA